MGIVHNMLGSINHTTNLEYYIIICIWYKKCRQSYNKTMFFGIVYKRIEWHNIVKAMCYKFILIYQGSNSYNKIYYSIIS